MGYELHITRREDWTDEGNDILAEEWVAIVESDPDLTFESARDPYFATWKGPDDVEPSWLDWRNGIISTKYPEPELIDKMVEIAKQLGAKVQGDEGELYERGEKPWESGPPAVPSEPEQPRPPSFLSRLFGRR